MKSETTRPPTKPDHSKRLRRLARLRIGARDPELISIKSLLVRLGYLQTGEDDNAFDRPLSDALEVFQGDSGLATTGLFDEATVLMLDAPRCGTKVQSSPLFLAPGQCGWPYNVIRYSIVNTSVNVTAADAIAAVEHGLRTLSLGGAPTFVPVELGDGGLDLRIAWMPALCGDYNMTGTIAAHADYPPACSAISSQLPQPIHFDDQQHVWTTDGSMYDIEATTLHEAGHVVGLLHSNDPNAVMFGTLPSSARRQLHDDDLSVVRELYRGVSQTAMIDSSGAVGPVIEDNFWTSGWTLAEPFAVGNSQFVLLLKHGSGDVHIHRLLPGGLIGDRVYDEKWTPWWSTAEFYTVGGDTYLFLLKERDEAADGNNVHIHEMNADGTPGPMIETHSWTEGWTTAEPFVVDGTPYLFLLKADGVANDGDNVHIHEINDDGSIGPLVDGYLWTEGWTTVELFTIGSGTFLFLLKERGTGGDDQNVHIHRMNSDGSVGQLVDAHLWSEGWTTAEFYRRSNTTYLFLAKVAGSGNDGNNVHIHKMSGDGSVGDKISSSNWGEGWTTASFYDSGGTTGLFIKRCEI